MPTFKEQVIEALPQGHEFSDIYSKTPEFSIVKTRYRGRVYELTMGKLDLSSLFQRLTVVPVGLDETYNDVYNRISERYGLGLVHGVDYYNGALVHPLDSLRFVSLPLLPDGYGYCGTIDCFLVHSSSTLATCLSIRDLTEVDQKYITRDLWTRTVLVSHVYTSNEHMFTEDRLSISFAQLLYNKLKDRSSLGLEVLLKAKVVDLLNDDLSDIMVILTPNGSEYLVRFQSTNGDLPEILISTPDKNILDENSKEILPGESVGESRWDKWKSEGGVSIGMGVLPIGNNDLLIPSLTPKEDNLTGEEKEEIVIPLIESDEELITFE